MRKEAEEHPEASLEGGGDRTGAGSGDSSALEMPRDVNWIMSILPHRYPLLMLDRVIALEGSEKIIAVKNVTINEEVFEGHFPGHPVLPGVLIVEGMAQAGGVLLAKDMTPEELARSLIYFSAIDRARFRRPVVPGDQIRYEVEVLRRRGATSKLKGRALVDGRVVADATLSSTMVER